MQEVALKLALDFRISIPRETPQPVHTLTPGSDSCLLPG